MNTSPESDKLTNLRHRLKHFVSERDWDQFHSPKNLVMALAGEVGELTEHFQWVSEAQSRDMPETALKGIREEIADVQIYLILLADRVGVDLLEAVEEKIRLNETKYPTHLAQGTSRKYTDL